MKKTLIAVLALSAAAVSGSAYASQEDNFRATLAERAALGGGALIETPSFFSGDLEVSKYQSNESRDVSDSSGR
ncbi:MAG: hypothetical protein AAGM38_10905 [Pseudomonadota bacterium]